MPNKACLYLILTTPPFGSLFATNASNAAFTRAAAFSFLDSDIYVLLCISRLRYSSPGAGREHCNQPRAPGSRTEQIRGGLDLEIFHFGDLLWSDPFRLSSEKAECERNTRHG